MELINVMPFLLQETRVSLTLSIDIVMKLWSGLIPCEILMVVILDNKLHLNHHVESLTSKAYCMCAFVTRSAKDLKKPSTHIYLFKTLKRSQLEYACAVWDPCYNKYKQNIESIQRNFLKTINYKLGDRLKLPRNRF